MLKNLSKRVNIANTLLDRRFKQGNACLQLAKEDARQRFITFGAPLEKDEYWKFSSPKRFLSTDVVGSEEKCNRDFFMNAADNVVKIVFVDGVLKQIESETNLDDLGIEVISMQEELGDELEWVKTLYGELEAQSHKQIKRPLAALNTACSSEGVFIRVKKKLTKKIIIQYLGELAKSDAMIPNLI